MFRADIAFFFQDKCPAIKICNLLLAAQASRLYWTNEVLILS